MPHFRFQFRVVSAADPREQSKQVLACVVYITIMLSISFVSLCSGQVLGHQCVISPANGGSLNCWDSHGNLLSNVPGNFTNKVKPVQIAYDPMARSTKNAVLLSNGSFFGIEPGPGSGAIQWQMDPIDPADPYVFISIGADRCGIRQSGAMDCVGSVTGSSFTSWPYGNYAMVACNNLATCAIDQQGQMTCMGRAIVPDTIQLGISQSQETTQWVWISGGLNTLCGILSNGFGMCFLDESARQFVFVDPLTSAPVKLIQLLGHSSDPTMMVGLTQDGRVLINNAPGDAINNVPASRGGKFRQIAFFLQMQQDDIGVYKPIVCGASTNGRVDCWPTIPFYNPLPIPPANSLVDPGVTSLINTGPTDSWSGLGCATFVGGWLNCWVLGSGATTGIDLFNSGAMQLVDPNLSFKSVSPSGTSLVCGLLNNGTAWCMKPAQGYRSVFLPQRWTQFDSICTLSSDDGWCGIESGTARLICSNAVVQQELISQAGSTTFQQVACHAFQRTVCAVATPNKVAVCSNNGAVGGGAIPSAPSYLQFKKIAFSWQYSYVIGILTNGTLFAWHTINFPIPNVGSPVLDVVSSSYACYIDTDQYLRCPILVGVNNDYIRDYAWTSNKVSSLTEGGCAVLLANSSTICQGAPPPVPIVYGWAPPGRYSRGARQFPCPLGTWSDPEGWGAQSALCNGPCAAGYFGVGSDSTCSGICPVGSYCPLGSVAPILCPAGRYGSAKGLSIPDCSGRCSPGYYCPAGTTSPTKFPCPAGRYGDSYELTDSDCTGECYAGAYCPSASTIGGQLRCTGRGTYCPSGSGEPRLVPPGKMPIDCMPDGAACADITDCRSGYACSGGIDTPCPPGGSSGYGQSACDNCYPGTYSSAFASEVCDSCTPGTYASTTGNTACLSCLPGKYSDDYGKTGCSSCSNGTYASDPGSDHCSTCPSGSISPASAAYCSYCPFGFSAVDKNGTSICVACPSGSTSGGGGAPCSPCAAGTFNNQTGQSACVPCPLGAYSHSNATVCTSCAVGTYAATTGNADCLVCLPGQFQNQTGMTACTACRNGTYAAQAASSSCTSCPSGSISPSGSPFCTNCPAGFSLIAGNAVSCYPCPTGSMSAGGGAECTLCSAGTFMNITAQSACKQCAIGTYAGNSGASVCTACGVGSYASTVGNAACLSCLPGQFTNVSGSTGCLLCTNGTFASAAGSSVCANCASGSTSPAGSPFCSNCPLGYSTSIEGRSSSSNGNPLTMTTCSACPAGTISGGGGAPCSPCAAGTFNNQTGQSACVPCPLGAYSHSNATVCTSCAVGTYAATTGSADCLVCLPGQFQSQRGQTTCMQCANGTFTSQVGSSICTNCATNRFSEAGSAFCSVCNPGFEVDSILNHCVLCQPGKYAVGSGDSCTLSLPGSFVSIIGATFSSPCAIGRYSNSSGHTECVDCSVGRYAPGTGSAECEMCASGLYARAEGLARCLSCQPGEFSSSGASQCEPCAVGRYTNATETKQCTDCPAGQFSQQLGSIACEDCQVGRYSASGSSVCIDCNPGKWSVAKASSCRLCVAGRYASGLGNANCTLCDAGKYQPDESGSECLTCGPLKYQDAQGMTTCQTCTTAVTPDHTSCASGECPPNQFYSVAESKCKVCALGSSSSGKAGVMCEVCPPNSYTPVAGEDCVLCDEAGLVCSNGVASVASGYWASTKQARRTDLQFAHVYLNQTDVPISVGVFRTTACSVCRGAALQRMAQLDPNNAAASSDNTSSASNSTMITHIQCESPHRDSMLCGECDDNYIPWGPNCVSCSKPNPEIIIACVIVSVGLVMFFYHTDASGAGFLDVSLYFVQTSMLIVGPLSNWLSFLSFVNLSPHSSSQCITQLTPYQQIVLSITTPLILIGELIVLAVLHAALYGVVAILDRCCLRNSRSACAAALKPFRRYSLKPYVGATFTVLMFSYTQVANACVSLLNCTYANDDSVVYAFPAIHCSGADYESAAILAMSFLGVYIFGFPVASLLYLWKSQALVRKSMLLVNKDPSSTGDSSEMSASKTKELVELTSVVNVNEDAHKKAIHENSPSAAGSTSDPSTDASDFLSWCGPLFASYRGDAWYWTSLMLLRRGAFVLVSVLIVADPSLRFMSFALLNFYSLVLHLLVKPFATVELNHADTLAHTILVSLSVMLTANLPPYGSKVQIAIFMLIVPASCIFVLFVFREMRPKLMKMIAAAQAFIASFKAQLNHIGSKDDPAKAKEIRTDETKGRNQSDLVSSFKAGETPSAITPTSPSNAMPASLIHFDHTNRIAWKSEDEIAATMK